MGLKAGALLWNRQAIQLPGGSVITSGHDTGLAQQNTSFADYSPKEPAINAAPPIGSRIQVIPQAPYDNWTGILHSEPYVDPSGKIVVDFLNPGNTVTINVLFWDPHSIVGPGDADLYGGMPFII